MICPYFCYIATLNKMAKINPQELLIHVTSLSTPMKMNKNIIFTTITNNFNKISENARFNYKCTGIVFIMKAKHFVMQTKITAALRQQKQFMCF